LVFLIGTSNLLLVAGIGILGLLVVMVLLLRLQAPQSHKQLRPHPKTDNNSSSLKRWHGIVMIALAILALVGFYFVDQIYQFQVGLRFTNEFILAGFLGAIEATIAIVILLSRLFVTGPFLSRYGLVVGLLALPTVAAVGAALMAITGTIYAAGIAFFSLAITSKLLVVALHKSTDRSAFQILYQSLSGGKQLRAQTIIDSLIQPGASGIAGLLLLSLSTIPLLIIYGLVAILGLWFTVVLFLGRVYKNVTTKALTRRVQGSLDIYLDSSTISIVERGLQSQNPGTVIYFLDILDQANHTSLEKILLEFLTHPSPEVRENVLERIEKRGLSSFSQQVRELIVPGPQQDTSYTVRGRAIRTLAALGEADVVDELQPFLQSPELPLKMGAMTGLLRSGGIEGVLVAGESLIEMAYSSDPEQRKFVASTLGAVNISGFYRPLIRLLQDKDTDVRQAAVLAAGRLKNPRLWPLVINCMQIRGLSQATRGALIEGGQSTLPFIKAAMAQDDLPANERINLLKVCGRIGGEQATVLLQENLVYPDAAVYNQTLKSLRACNYHVTGDEALHIEQLVFNEFAGAAWTLACLEDLSNTNYSLQSDDLQRVQAIELLLTALKHKYWRHIEQSILLLSFIYMPQPLLDAWEILQDSDDTSQRYAIALETIDRLVPQSISELLIPLLDNLSIPQKLQRMVNRYPQERLLPTYRLQAILASPDIQFTPWTIICVAWALFYIDPPAYQRYLEEHQSVHGTQTGEPLSLIPQPGDQEMLTLIEKVLLLKTIYILSDTPDEVLAAMADLFEEVVFKKDEIILQKGEPGKSLYVVIDGEVRIHDGERTFAIRGGGEVLGEMSLLDGQPISASVTATQTTRMLRMDHQVFYELMADRIEIARGIIRTLSLRLRALMEAAPEEPEPETPPELQIATL
jgi:HEAT repeat protein